MILAFFHCEACMVADSNELVLPDEKLGDSC